MKSHRVTQQIAFCYGHRLLDYDGKCRHPHGHNGLAELTFAADKLDARGMVLDFTDIKRVMKAWIDAHLDHRMLLRRDDPLIPTLAPLMPNSSCGLLSIAASPVLSLVSFQSLLKSGGRTGGDAVGKNR